MSQGSIKPVKVNRRRPIADRLWEKIDKSSGQNGCWEWTAYKTRLGYGKIALPGDSGSALSHRIVYELEVGAIPDGFVVMHVCDNPSCCNPAHLRPGTQAENLEDMRSKGRECRGPAMTQALANSAKFKARDPESQARNRSDETGKFLKNGVIA